jgi:hypothetical protein
MGGLEGMLQSSGLSGENYTNALNEIMQLSMAPTDSFSWLENVSSIISAHGG